MIKNDGVTPWKYLALGAVGIYLYKAMRANGGTLNGNPHQIYFNSDKLVDHIMVHTNINPDLRPFVERACKKAAAKVLNNRRPIEE